MSVHDVQVQYIRTKKRPAYGPLRLPVVALERPLRAISLFGVHAPGFQCHPDEVDGFIAGICRFVISTERDGAIKSDGTGFRITCRHCVAVSDSPPAALDMDKELIGRMTVHAFPLPGLEHKPFAPPSCHFRAKLFPKHWGNIDGTGFRAQHPSRMQYDPWRQTPPRSRQGIATGAWFLGAASVSLSSETVNQGLIRTQANWNECAYP